MAHRDCEDIPRVTPTSVYDADRAEEEDYTCIRVSKHQEPMS